MKNQYEIDYQQGYDKANDEWLERLDKIRAEIKELPTYFREMVILDEVMQILDKYKAEIEPQESEET